MVSFPKIQFLKERTAKLLLEILGRKKTYSNIQKFYLLKCLELMYSASDFHACCFETPI